MRTVIGVCLDESGSMGERGKREAAIESLNAYIRDQQASTADECLMAIVKFNTVASVFATMGPVIHVPTLNTSNYTPAGGTALHDAIAYTVRDLERGLREDDRVLVVILTDGEENSSRETTKSQIRDLIDAKTRTGRWSFVYLSASLNAFSEAKGIGIPTANAFMYENTGTGHRGVVAAASSATRNYRIKSDTSAMNFAEDESFSNIPNASVAPEDVAKALGAVELTDVQASNAMEEALARLAKEKALP